MFLSFLFVHIFHQQSSMSLFFFVLFNISNFLVVFFLFILLPCVFPFFFSICPFLIVIPQANLHPPHTLTLSTHPRYHPANTFMPSSHPHPTSTQAARPRVIDPHFFSDPKTLRFRSEPKSFQERMEHESGCRG